MYAIMKTHEGPGFSLEETPPPAPGAGKIAIRPLYGAISAADLHQFRWDGWAQKYGKIPMVVGKEFVGEVIEVGPKVKGFTEGDLVTGDLGVDLGDPGCFASTFTLPSSKAYLVPKNIETKSAALVSALGAAVQTVRQFPVKGKTLFIAGAGAVGIMTALVAKEFGARAVSIFDPSSYRQTLAQGLGIDPLQDKEYDLAFEISGSQEGLTDCLRKVKKGGAIVLVGFQLPNSEAPWKLIVEKKLQVQGIFGRTPKSWEIALQLAQKGFPLSSLITHVYPFEEYEQAFDVALEGRCAKVLLEWKRKQKITLAPSVSEAA